VSLPSFLLQCRLTNSLPADPTIIAQQIRSVQKSFRACATSTFAATDKLAFYCIVGVLAQRLLHAAPTLAALCPARPTRACCECSCRSLNPPDSSSVFSIIRPAVAACDTGTHRMQHMTRACIYVGTIFSTLLSMHVSIHGWPHCCRDLLHLPLTPAV
jgi:hypothetical protein